MKAFASALVTNQLRSLVVCPGATGTQSVLVDLSIHLAAVLLCGNEQILAPLQNLSMQPADMQVCLLSAAFSVCNSSSSSLKHVECVFRLAQAAFLPTMPEDMLEVARQAMGPLQWYCK